MSTNPSDDAAVPPELASDIHDIRLKATLQRVPIARDTSLFIEVDDVARIARKRMVTAITGHRAFQRANRVRVLRSDANLLQTQNVGRAELSHDLR